MKVYQLHSKQKLPISLEKAWDFFSSPENLARITPDYMGFDIVSGADRKTYAGQIIQYKVSPLLGIKMNWVTEITQVQAPHYFVDEQRFGPYKLWHHKHFLKEIEGGVEMEDIVHYALPFGILGQMVHPFMVKGKLDEIFGFRQRKLVELFGEWEQRAESREQRAESREQRAESREQRVEK